MSEARIFPRPFGRYTLLRPRALAVGGEIFLATTATTDGRLIPCVIRRIAADRVGVEFDRGLHDEARAWARFVHPNVVRVLETGQIDGDAFIAMELVDGCALGTVWRRCFERQTPLPIESTVYIAGRLAGALAYIHSFEDLHLTHRDVSPGNVLLSFQGDVRLTKFGLAPSTLNTDDTDRGAMAGKGSYLSPEQANGRRLDARTDIYSAGIVFWELLAGRPLFAPSKGGGWDRNAIPPPSEFDHKVPPSLDRIVMKTLAVRPERRYQSAAELLADLDAAVPTPQTATALGGFLADIFGENRSSERVIAASNGSRSPEPSAETVGEIPQPRQAERTVPTNLFKRFLSRLSSRWRRYGVAIGAVLIVEVAGAVLFFRSAPVRSHGAGVASLAAPTALSSRGTPGALPSSAPTSEPPRVISSPPLESWLEERAPLKNNVPLPPEPGSPELRTPRQAAAHPGRPATVRTAPSLISAPAPSPKTAPPSAEKAAVPPATTRPAPTAAPTSAPTVPQTSGSTAALPPAPRPTDRAVGEVHQETELATRAEAAFRAGLPLDAIRLAKKSLASGGGARAKMVLAETYFDLRLFQEALAAYSDILVEQPENQAARVGRDLAGAEVTRSREGGRPPPQKAQETATAPPTTTKSSTEERDQTDRARSGTD